MKIIQLVSNLNYGDAIGNDVIAIHQTLTEAGYDARVMALSLHPLAAEKVVMMELSAAQVNQDDLVIYHKAAGDALVSLYGSLPCRRVLLYHNITPASFFLPYDAIMSWNLARGRRQLRRLRKSTDWGWADSCYNASELKKLGYPAENVQTLPIILNQFGQHTEPDADAIARMRGRPGTRFLFVGRIAPNKKQEDVIKTFAVYRQMIDPQAQLYLVGSWRGNGKYYAKLRGFIDDLKLEGVHFSGHITDEELSAYYQCADVFLCMSEHEGFCVPLLGGFIDDLKLEGVHFSGHITDEELSAYYQCADVFLCMSEHEGFCVPLLEAMQQDVPVVAYAAAAVPETLGENGLLFRQKDYVQMAEKIHQVLTNDELRRTVLEKQRANLTRFEPSVVRRQLLSMVEQVLEGGASV